LCGEQIANVRARHEEDERHENTEDQQRTAIDLLQ
jgi:hypothetical protein